ncbi:probable protein S-acyltransferase 7 [Magnolia sinica]|uniref:probable protein S-acyltransferase 7 n=1 Tax=Magnolia sinica TaxID=86752 RepID=UPI002657D9B3|nr:probable protein S-acyltransferase 7 [Magnolia sinica]
MQNQMMYSAPQRSLSNRRIIDTRGQSKRLYQVWKGGNRFFLGGRLIFGPDVRSLVLTILLIVVPVIIFASFISQRLINEFQHHLGKLIVAIPVIFMIYVLCILFLTSGRDPGIIPRSTHPPESEDDGDACLSIDWAGNQGPTSSLPPTKDVLVNGMVVKVKYCHTCMLYRPPRCSHCSICNNCVDRFDHHCPWVGQCIGKRNYRFFFMFVSSTTMLCLYIFAFCWVNIKKIMDAYQCNLWRAFLKTPMSAVLIIYTFIAAWFVGGLTAFHIYLISTNQTTYENFRFRYEGKVNPYDLGWAKNIREIFCSRIPSSHNNFRARVNEDFASSTASLPRGHVLSPEIAKASLTIDMGSKRQAVAADEFEDIQNQIGLERSRSQARHSNWVQKGNWEIMPDMQALPSEFGMEHKGFTDREKISH